MIKLEDIDGDEYAIETGVYNTRYPHIVILDEYGIALDQKKAAELAAILQRFAETGRLAPDAPHGSEDPASGSERDMKW